MNVINKAQSYIDAGYDIDAELVNNFYSAKHHLNKKHYARLIIDFVEENYEINA